MKHTILILKKIPLFDFSGISSARSKLDFEAEIEFNQSLKKLDRQRVCLLHQWSSLHPTSRTGRPY